MTSFLRQYVFHNFTLKLLSLLASVLLWMAVARDPIAEVAITVPIEFQHVPKELEIGTEKIPPAEIRVRGPGRLLRNLGPAEVHATLDLDGAKPGERTYELRGPVIQVPREVEVVQVVPPQLHLTFDRRARNEVPIRARVVGLYAGSRRTVVGVDPPVALIVGPEQHVNAIDAVLTDAVDAAGVTGRATFSRVHIYVTDPLVQVVRPSSVEVTVAEEAAPSRPSRSFSPAQRH